MTDPNNPKKSAPGGEPGAEAAKYGQEAALPKDIIAGNGADGKGKTSRIACVDELAPVRDYLNRVGAKATSMFAAVIAEQRGAYKKELARIRFDKDGEIFPYAYEGDKEEIEPRDAERDAIRAAILGARFIQIKPLVRLAHLLPEMAEAKAKDKDRPWPKYLHEFRDASGQIVMVQTRHDTPATDPRGKYYMEWTFWEDNQWRCQRPDVLPLWGQDQLPEHGTVFIHEGAKTAAYCRWLVSEERAAREARAAHPWADEMRGAAHVGWVGGAPSPHLTDWAALGKAGITRAIIVPDNDKPGERAVTSISRSLARTDMQVSRVVFDERFPPAFDLAEGLPASMVKGGRYCGPRLAELMFPATWATVKQKGAGAGRPSYALREPFAEAWAMVTDEGKSMFIPRHSPACKLSESGFNDKAQPSSDARDVAPLLKKFTGAQFDRLAYRPGEKAQSISENNTRFLNVWRGPRLAGNKGADPGPWTDYLAHLIPDESDRAHVMKWLATLIARPDIRIGYGMLLFSSTQGTGKSTMGIVLKKVLGAWNVSEPNENDVVGSDNNDWVAEKQLVFVNEIYAGSSWKAYHKLKPYITEESVRINTKYVPQYTIENRAHFILCSNEAKAISMAKDDRRFLMPRVAEKLRDQKAWADFHVWLAGDGPAVISQWAEDYVVEHGAVKPGDHAPSTERKEALIHDTKNRLERALADLAGAARVKAGLDEAAWDMDEAEADEAAKEGPRPVVLVDKDVEDWLLVMNLDPKGLSHIRHSLVNEGLFETKRVKIGGRAGAVRQCLLTNLARVQDIDAAYVKQWRMSPSDLLPDWKAM
ncbi:MAG: DUF5906 domain-containing protein [Loktanella sp.]|nr:DUF5906 domain-containing protein [Loktanella sp.]